MSKVTTLRTWHPLHWLFGQLVPWTSSRAAKPVSQAFYLGLSAVAAIAGGAAVTLWGFNGLLVPPTILVLGIYLRIRPVAGSVAWAIGGGGRPVLEIADGRVRGRFRPLWSDESRSSDVWWDLDIPAADLLGARVDRHFAGPTLVLDLPAHIAAVLCTDPATARWVTTARDRVGSPAAWQVGIMRPLGLRQPAVRGLLAALAAEGVPVSAL